MQDGQRVRDSDLLTLQMLGCCDVLQALNLGYRGYHYDQFELLFGCLEDLAGDTARKVTPLCLLSGVYLLLRVRNKACWSPREHSYS